MITQTLQLNTRGLAKSIMTQPQAGRTEIGILAHAQGTLAWPEFEMANAGQMRTDGGILAIKATEQCILLEQGCNLRQRFAHRNDKACVGEVMMKESESWQMVVGLGQIAPGSAYREQFALVLAQKKQEFFGSVIGF